MNLYLSPCLIYFFIRPSLRFLSYEFYIEFYYIQVYISLLYLVNVGNRMKHSLKQEIVIYLERQFRFFPRNFHNRYVDAR